MTDTIAIICMVSGILLILSAWIDGSKSGYTQQREDEYDDEEYEDEYYDEDDYRCESIEEGKQKAEAFYLSRLKDAVIEL
jgi:hypothetical protein